MARWQLLSLLAALAHSSALATLSTHSGGIESLKTPFSGLKLQKQWAVSGSSLRELEVRTFGRVFVELATDDDRDNWDSEQLASVTVYSDSSDLLEIFDVAALDDSGLSLRVKNRNAEAKGLVFSRVRVLKEALRDVKLTGSADVYVGDDVLSSGEDVKVVVTGSGDVDIGLTTDLSISKLSATISGSGDIWINAPTVSVSDRLELHVAGSGDITIAAESVDFADVDVSVSGSGDILLDQESGGSCSREEIVLTGSGDIDTSSVACNSVSIDLTGSGDVVFQAVDDVTASIVGSGDLEYVNSLPEHVKLTGPYSHKRLQSSLKHVSLRKNHKYRSDGGSKNHHGHFARIVEVQVVFSNSQSTPTVHIFADSDPNASWATGFEWGSGIVSFGTTNEGDSDVLVIGLGSGGVAGVVIYAYIRRQRRQGYNILA